MNPRSVPALTPFALRSAVALLTLGLGCTIGAGAARADAIDDAIVEQMPAIVKALKSNEYKTVGVLPFRFSRSGQHPSFHVGSINKSLADRLEMALQMEAADEVRRFFGVAAGPGSDVFLLAKPNPKVKTAMKKAQTLRVINNPEGLVKMALERSQLKPANGRSVNFWDSADDRLALFAAKLQGSGTDPMLDSLVTGEIVLSEDSRTAAIKLVVFDAKFPKEMKPLHQFEMKVERMLLAECGQSFVVSRKEDGTKDATDSALKSNTNAGARALDDPVLASPENPVQLKIYYNGNLHSPKPAAKDDACQYMVSEIKEGTQLTFKLKNTSGARVGVVLAINGENTLFQQSLEEISPAQCTKWILDPDEEQEIKGFYFGDGTECKPFAIVGEAPLRPGLNQVVMNNRGVFDDADHKGVFALYVFRQSDKPAAGPKISRDLRQDRGYVVPGPTAKTGKKFERINDFKHADEPAVSLAIRYKMPTPP